MADPIGNTAETIEIDLGDGAVLHAVVRGSRPRCDSGDAGAVSVAAQHTFNEVRATIQAVGQWAKDTAARCGDPSSFEVEFGLTLSVKSGRLIGVLAEAGEKRACWSGSAGTAPLPPPPSRGSRRR
ncbi:CU044_2847 family protein [Streptomyces hesseae]|uniref:CU044_2847 family protein n=1 Tax=Streptomyces hesseae TaxID=3075519 RepID=A0ABU2SFN6_9ACTN|nr:CU044_2847 family protein [Streptomyces sp. DSM 40473]MDT0447777.1 CU044_2847 family protein [Streptomyces sp. DSM 40473]